MTDRRDTLPKLLRAQRARAWRRDRAAREAVRHLAQPHLGRRTRRARAPSRSACSALGIARGRRGRADRRQPAGLGDGRDRGACARRAHRLGIYRDALDDEVAYLLDFSRRAASSSPRTRSRSTSCSTSPTSVPSLRAHRLSPTRAACASTTTRACSRWTTLMQVGAASAGCGRAARSGTSMVAATRRRGRSRSSAPPRAPRRGRSSRMLTGARADPALRGLSAGRSEGAAGRIRLGPAAALDHGADLRARLGPDRAHEGQLRRGTRDDDGRFPRDRRRPSCCSRRASGRRIAAEVRAQGDGCLAAASGGCSRSA